jgi:cell division protein FtsW
VSGRRPAERPTGDAVARYLLLGSVLFLTLTGLVMIYSASSVSDLIRHGSSSYHLVRQLAFIGLGLVLALAASRFDYRRLSGISFPLWVLCIALLVLTMSAGSVRGGAQRWLMLGGFQLQPSELMKVAAVLAVAALAARWRRGKLTEPQFLGQAAFLAGVPAILILLQPDLGTTVTLIAGVLAILYASGVRLRWIGVLGAMTALAAVIAVAVEPYRVQRFMAFLDPWSDPMGKGYQTVQAMLAFGTGGVDGLGLGLSRQKFFYLPEAHTDFVLAIVGEEVGLIGTLAIVIAFGVFAYAGIRIALGSRDMYGRLLAGGLTAMIGTQAIINMAAVTNLLPVTGKPLPFVSYGGSALSVMLACVGILLSVSTYGVRTPRPVRRPSAEKEGQGASVDERRRDRGARLPRDRSRQPVRRGA